MQQADSARLRIDSIQSNDDHLFTGKSLAFDNLIKLIRCRWRSALLTT